MLVAVMPEALQGLSPSLFPIRASKETQACAPAVAMAVASLGRADHGFAHLLYKPPSKSSVGGRTMNFRTHHWWSTHLT